MPATNGHCNKKKTNEDFVLVYSWPSPIVRLALSSCKVVSLINFPGHTEIEQLSAMSLTTVSHFDLDKMSLLRKCQPLPKA